MSYYISPQLFLISYENLYGEPSLIAVNCLFTFNQQARESQSWRRCYGLSKEQITRKNSLFILNVGSVLLLHVWNIYFFKAYISFIKPWKSWRKEKVGRVLSTRILWVTNLFIFPFKSCIRFFLSLIIIPPQLVRSLNALFVLEQTG